MNSNTTKKQADDGLILVLGGTGKTGRRIVSILEAKGVPTRVGSRSAVPSFDWNNEANWDDSLDGVEAAYINYSPDLAMPGATDSIQAFVDRAKRHGVKHLVLLSGRGEEEAQACERIVQGSGVDWTIVRASWFNQNFSETFVEPVRHGVLAMPGGGTAEPFLDANDIAAVVDVGRQHGLRVTAHVHSAQSGKDAVLAGVDVAPELVRQRLDLDQPGLLDGGVLFLFDRGLLGHGHTLHTELVSVPLVIAGPGVPEEESPRIFEAFFQGRREQGGHVAGTGIGLSVVLECIQAHDGSVSLVDTGEFSGAHFRIYIPQERMTTQQELAANA